MAEKASILPPQIIGLALRLGEGFENADTAQAMMEAVAQKRGARA